MRSFFRTAAVVLWAMLGNLFAQCGSPGVQGIPSLRISSPAVERTAEFRVRDGAPNADWVAFVDVNPGPTALPFGTLCLGATPTLLFSSFAGTAPILDASGAANLPIVLPALLGALEGIPFFYQALIVDPTTASGISISDRLARSFRRPRVFVGSSVPGNAYVARLEPTSGAIDHDVPVSRGVSQILAAPQEGRTAALLWRESTQDLARLVILDDETGDVLYSKAEFSYGEMALANDDRTLLVPVLLSGGFVLRTIDLETFVETDVPLPAVGSQLIPHPTQDIVFVSSPYFELTPVDYRTGATGPTIVTGLVPVGWPGGGGPLTYAIDGTTLYVASYGNFFGHNAYAPGVATVDLSTNSLGPAVFFSFVDAPVISLAFAVGTNGPGLFVRAASGVRELDPTTLAVRRTIAQGGFMTLSSGGSELYFLDDVGLRVYDLATDAVTTLLATTDTMSEPVAAPGRLYFVDDRNLYGVATDPAGVPQVVTSLATGPNLPNRVLFQLAAD